MSHKQRKGYIIRWIIMFVVIALVLGPGVAWLGATIHCLIVYVIRRKNWQNNTFSKVLFGA